MDTKPKPDPIIGMKVGWIEGNTERDRIFIGKTLIRLYGGEDMVVDSIKERQGNISPDEKWVVTLSRDSKVIYQKWAFRAMPEPAHWHGKGKLLEVSWYYLEPI